MKVKIIGPTLNKNKEVGWPLGYPHPDYGLWVVMTTIRPTRINITPKTSRSMMRWGVLNNISNHMLIKLK